MAAILKSLFTKVKPTSGGLNFKPNTLPELRLSCFVKSAKS